MRGRFTKTTELGKVGVDNFCSMDHIKFPYDGYWFNATSRGVFPFTVITV